MSRLINGTLAGMSDMCPKCGGSRMNTDIYGDHASGMCICSIKPYTATPPQEKTLDTMVEPALPPVLKLATVHVLNTDTLPEAPIGSRLAQENELLVKIKDTIYSYAGRITVATVLGTLELVKHDLIRDSFE
jgi:hypothetical protein